MISLELHNKFEKTSEYLTKCLDVVSLKKINSYGLRGVELLSKSTPQKTGLTASSWTYEAIKCSEGYKLVFKNTNVVNGEPIALLIQYGHGTNNGGYVEGRDYINPALKTLVLEIENDLRKELIIK